MVMVEAVNPSAHHREQPVGRRDAWYSIRCVSVSVLLVLIAVLVFAFVTTAMLAFRDPAHLLARELQTCRAQELCGEVQTPPCEGGGMTPTAARDWAIENGLKASNAAWGEVLANLRAGGSLEDASPAARVLRVTAQRGEDARGVWCLIKTAAAAAARGLMRPVNMAVAAVVLGGTVTAWRNW